MNANDWGDLLAATALKWNGVDFHEGQKEQCMNFVRNVFQEAHHPYAAKVTSKPVDGHWTGPSLASSLAGRDLGEMVTKISALEAGDVLFWNDTYSTGFPPGTITHVGIALGPDRFIHRNTVSRPVNIQPYEGMWRSNFRCALRVPQQIKPDAKVVAPLETAMAKLWFNANGATVQVRQELDPGRYSLFSTGSCTDGGWLFKLVDDRAAKPAAQETSRLWVNGNGMTLELRETIKPGSFSVFSSGSEAGGALLLKAVRK